MPIIVANRGSLFEVAAAVLPAQSANPVPSGFAGIYGDVLGAVTLSPNLYLQAPLLYRAAYATIASATTIAPTDPVTFISGTTNIATITVPFTGYGGVLHLIPTAVWHTVTSDNIGLATTAVVGKVLSLFYSTSDGKWYPSY